MTLSPERAVRLLRAKAAELEHKVLLATELQEQQGMDQAYIAATEFKYLCADIALVATLLADHIQDLLDSGDLPVELEDYVAKDTKTGRFTGTHRPVEEQ